MNSEEKHTFLTEMECARNPFDFKLNGHELLIDLKVLIKEYYAVTFTEDGGALILNFTNGQKFKLIVEETK